MDIMASRAACKLRTRAGSDAALTECAAEWSYTLSGVTVRILSVGLNVKRPRPEPREGLVRSWPPSFAKPNLH